VGTIPASAAYVVFDCTVEIENTICFDKRYRVIRAGRLGQPAGTKQTFRIIPVKGYPGRCQQQ
jgi:hypothetical protein